jgi:hypothetical protein
MRSPFQFPPRLQRDLLLRTALLWVGVRVGVAALVAGAAGSGLPPMDLLTPGMSLGTMALVGIALLVDVRVCRETLLLGNLGLSRAQLTIVAFGVSGFAEAGVHAVAALT